MISSSSSSSCLFCCTFSLPLHHQNKHTEADRRDSARFRYGCRWFGSWRHDQIWIAGKERKTVRERECVSQFQSLAFSFLCLCQFSLSLYCLCVSSSSSSSSACAVATTRVAAAALQWRSSTGHSAPGHAVDWAALAKDGCRLTLETTDLGLGKSRK